MLVLRRKQPVEKVPAELGGGKEEFARAELLFEREIRAKGYRINVY